MNSSNATCFASTKSLKQIQAINNGNADTNSGLNSSLNLTAEQKSLVCIPLINTTRRPVTKTTKEKNSTPKSVKIDEKRASICFKSYLQTKRSDISCADVRKSDKVMPDHDIMQAEFTCFANSFDSKHLQSKAIPTATISDLDESSMCLNKKNDNFGTQASEKGRGLELISVKQELIKKDFNNFDSGENDSDLLNESRAVPQVCGESNDALARSGFDPDHLSNNEDLHSNEANSSTCSLASGDFEAGNSMIKKR